MDTHAETCKSDPTTNRKYQETSDFLLKTCRSILEFVAKEPDTCDDKQQKHLLWIADELNCIIAMIHNFGDNRLTAEEKAKIQIRFSEPQKMESFGTPVGCMAHDINNLLSIIMGCTELQMMKTEETNSLYEYLQNIHIACIRASSLTKQMMLFSRNQPADFKNVNINEVVKDSLKMFKCLIKSNIVLKTNLANNVWPIFADEENISQAIMNLLINARDAMPSGGICTVKTENIELDEKLCTIITNSRPGKFVLLSIVDTGTGLDKDIISHIFEPFFTTKKAGKGTGLGLYIVQKILSLHHGWLNIQSSPTTGTEFKLYLLAFFGNENRNRIL